MHCVMTLILTLFSAKGAAFISSLGQRPRDSCNAKPPALRARFIPASICVGLTANRRVESRFQRWSIIRSESWGDAPGWYESALLALNRYVKRPVRCTAPKRRFTEAPLHPNKIPPKAQG